MTDEIKPKRDESGKFLKGQSGNPKGRPKVGETLAELVRGSLEKVIIDDDGNSTTRLNIIINSLVQKASEGDVKAGEVLLDRGYGKAKTFLEITTKEEFIVDWGEDSLIEGEVLDEENQNQLTATTS